MHAKRLTLTLTLALALTLSLLISLSRAAPGNPDPDPNPNIHTTPPTSTVSLTYDEDMDISTVSTQTFAVHTFQTGLLTATYGVRGGSIMLTPTRPFFPGELVQTTATTRTLSITGEQPLSYTVWGFRAAARDGSGAFAPHPISPVFGAGYSIAVALGDVDGDGDLDAIIANYGDRINGDPEPQDVYLNDGYGAFSVHPISPTFGAGWSRDVALGDVDGDGDLDAIVLNLPAPQYVYLNDGYGAFSPHPISPTFDVGWSRAVALGDVDGDGDLDAIVANWDEAQDVYLNDGGGGFRAHPISPAFGTGRSIDITLGDVDGDGDLDAIVANYDGQSQKVFLNDGAGEFSAHPSAPAFGGGNSTAVVLGDVDGDGDLDAVVANFGRSQKVYLNDGGGAFSTYPGAPAFGPSTGSTDVALGDVDGDGDLDAVVANYNRAQYVYLNDGGGAFSPRPGAPTFGMGLSYAVALGDMDGDGDLDAVVANTEGKAQGIWLNRNRVIDVAPALNSHDVALDASLSITANCPISLSSVSTHSLFVHGGFHGHVSGKVASTVPDTGSASSILYDPDDDWFPGELVQATVTGGVLDSVETPIFPYVWGFRTVTQGGSGAFAAHPISPTFGGGDSFAVALGDVDGDGDLDAIVANSGFLGNPQEVYLNHGDGAFSAHPISPTFGAGNSWDVALGDVDGDDDLDAIVANYDGQAQEVYLNDGDGAFSAHPISPTFGADWSRDVALGDVDGDGDLDAVIANYDAAQKVYFNNGDGAFGTRASAPSFGASDSQAVTLGDVDGDGDLDAIVANWSAAQEVYFNNGRGAFKARASAPGFGAGLSWDVALGDVDGDGDLDAIVTNYDAAQEVCLNDGDGAFSAHPSAPSFGAESSFGLALGDVDGDGDLDAIVANWGAAQEVYLNDGYGAFSPHPISPGFGTGDSVDVTLGDVDGDGDLDAIVANFYGATQTVWLNRNYADLSITKSVQTGAAPGDPITYTLAFSNNGPGTTNSIRINDSVPVSVVVSGQWSVGGDITRTPGVTFEWTVSQLAPGQGGVITITGMLTSPLARDHVFSNTASITSTDIDTDTTNNSDLAEVTVSDAPPVAVDDGGAEYTTDEDSAFSTGNVLANDYDANGDALTVAGFDASGALGLVSDNSDGTFDYDPDGQFEYLAIDQQAVDTFSYVIGSGTGTLSDAAAVTIIINGVNDAPTANDDSDVTPYNTPVTIDVLNNDSDPENDTLSVVAVGPAAHGETAIVGVSVVYSPTRGFSGLDDFTYTVSDGEYADTATLIIRVQEAPFRVFLPLVLKSTTPFLPH